MATYPADPLSFTMNKSLESNLDYVFVSKILLVSWVSPAGVKLAVNAISSIG